MPLINSTTLNTRIQLKYDTYANWMESTLPILPGEMAVAIANLALEEAAGATVIESAQQVGYKPAVLIKIGDGVQVTDATSGELRYKTFAELDYVQAKAGDVYAWAKAPNRPTSDQLTVGPSAGLDHQNETIWSWLYQLSQKADTNTIYELEFGTNDNEHPEDTTKQNQGKIRLNYKTAGSAGAYTPGTWKDIYSFFSAGDDSITFDKGAISAKISSDNNNALSVNTTSTKEGLYVPKTNINRASSATSTAGQQTVQVLTSLVTTPVDNTFTANYANVYTTQEIDAMLNPSMEFKGVKTAAELDAMTITDAMVGDSYKVSTNGSASLLATPLKTVKAGDLAIACKTSEEDPLTHVITVERFWSIIPAGDDATEALFRPVFVDGSQALSSALNSGYVNFVAGDGISLAINNNDGEGGQTTVTVGNEDFTATEVVIGLDVNSIASASETAALRTHTGYGGGLGTYDDNGTTRNYTVKQYVDAKVAEIDVSNLVQDDTYLVFNCGNASGWPSASSPVVGD